MSTKSYADLVAEQGFKRISDIRYGVERQGLEYLRTGPIDTEFKKDVTPSSLTYSTAENSYSGTDCTIAIIYNEEIVILGNVQTATYSVHRDKYPVRTLGRTYAKDYVRGQRTIAGSLVFIQFNEAPLYALYNFFNQKLENEHRFSSPIADEIPPFDMMLIFNNEYGKSSIIRLYGVEITDEGGTFSINDIYSENVMQFIAKDIDPMISDGGQDKFKNLMYNKMVQGKILDPHYNSLLEYKIKLEANLADVDRELTATSRLAGRSLRRTESGLGGWAYQNGSQWYRNRIERQNQERTLAKGEYELLQTKRERILVELQRLNETIARYERTKMTWDMNSAVESNFTSSPNFTQSAVRT